MIPDTPFVMLVQVCLSIIMHSFCLWSTGVSLDPCSNRTCIFDCDTNSECYDEMIICTSNVNICKILCSWELSCRGAIIFSAATITTIVASDDQFSLGDANVFCGSFESQSFWDNLSHNDAFRNENIDAINKSSLMVSQNSNLNLSASNGIYQQCIVSCNESQV